MYRVQPRVENGIEKTYVTWEIDPTVLARFASVDSNDLESTDVQKACELLGLDLEVGRAAPATNASPAAASANRGDTERPEAITPNVAEDAGEAQEDLPPVRESCQTSCDISFQ